MAFLLDKGFLMLYICRWFLVDRTGSRYWFSKEEDVQEYCIMDALDEVDGSTFYDVLLFKNIFYNLCSAKYSLRVRLQPCCSENYNDDRNNPYNL